MRIALVTSSYAPYVGGVEEHVRNLARRLRDRGDEVVVWTVARDGRFDVREVDGISVWDLPAVLPARSMSAGIGFLAGLPATATSWRRAFRAFRPDLLHVHCFGPNGTYARVVAGATRTPMVVTSHGETLGDDHGVFSQSLLAKYALRSALSAAGAVTGCSQVVIDDLESRFSLQAGRGVVVPNGVDLDEPVGEPPADVDGRYIAAVGRLERMKGFDLLLDAFAAADLPEDVRLVIGGAGSQASALRAQAARLGIQERFVLTGRLDRPQVGGLLQNAIAGVVPSRFEGFGIAVLEIWRAGRPLIATNRGGPAGLVLDGVDGILVDPGESATLADALRIVVGDPRRAGELAAAGALRVRSLTWDRVVNDYRDLYVAAVRPHAGELDGRVHRRIRRGGSRSASPNRGDRGDVSADGRAGI